MENKKKNPLKAEAQNDSVSFEFRGIALTTPMGDAYPMAAVEAFEDSKFVAFVRALLGPEQMKKVQGELNTFKDLRELAEAINAAQDTSLGE